MILAKSLRNTSHVRCAATMVSFNNADIDAEIITFTGDHG